METADFLTHEREAIVDAAEAALARMRARHYESAGASEARQRLEALYDHLLDALRSRDLGPIVAHAEHVAQERFSAGYDLSEVQAAFNTLEEATWSRRVRRIATDAVRGGARARQHDPRRGKGRARAQIRLARHEHTRSFARLAGPVRGHRGSDANVDETAGR